MKRFLVSLIFGFLCLSFSPAIGLAAPVFDFSMSEQWDNNVYRTSNPSFIASDNFTGAAFTATDYEKIGEGYLILQGRYDGLFYNAKNDLNLSLATLSLGWWGELSNLTQYQLMAKYKNRSYQNYAGSGSYGGSLDLYQRWGQLTFQERYEVEGVSTYDNQMKYTNNLFGLYVFWAPISRLTLGTGYHYGFGDINFNFFALQPFNTNIQGWSLFSTYALSRDWQMNLGYESQSSTMNPFGTPAFASRQITYAGIYYRLK